MDSKAIARALAEESIVLLKNEGGLLPLAKGSGLAVFGRAQVDTVCSGSGSGAADTQGCGNILEELEKAGLRPVPDLAAHYRANAAPPSSPPGLAELGQLVTSGAIYEIFGRYTPTPSELPLTSGQVSAAASYADTALFVLGRSAGGEECDRHLPDDYLLTESERALLEAICWAFDRVILVLNTNGLVDLSWTEDYPQIRSILFLGVPGAQGAAALANLLTGEANPSGKLAFTIARRYEDYPTAPHFTWDKDNPDAVLTYESYGLPPAPGGFAKSPVTVYKEGLFLGYRYFDTFGVEPLYPFGFGLSYTAFALEQARAEKTAAGITLRVQVKNTGKIPGKETVQVYLARLGMPGRPAQELKGFAKTKLLAPGETQEVAIPISWRELACYDEEKAAYGIPAGDALLRVGNSSRSTEAAALLRAAEEIPVEQCAPRLPLAPGVREAVGFLTCAGQSCPSSAPVISLVPADVPRRERNFAVPEIPAVVKGLTVEQLAALCVGFGPGTPFAAFGGGKDPSTIFDESGRPLTANSHPVGRPGYVSPAIEEKGIRSVYYKDGPAGVGDLAWPCEMLMACAFNRELWYAFGDAVGAACEERQVEVWLAPAVNLHRHPLGGRNFEYFSEDPHLSGVCAVEIAKGAQENHPVLVCPKHFALNEQETFRRGSARKHYDAVDSIVTQQAARELYLRPFEMLVREAGVACVMTSFNKINGCFAGGNRDLCTHILREEWGFSGAVVTDWGDMDFVVDGADAVAAGNDIVMPGGPPVIAQILQGYEQGRVTRPQLETAVANLLRMCERVNDKKK